MWDLAKNSTKTVEKKKKLLLAKLYVLQEVWDLAEDNPMKEKIKNNLLLATDSNELPPGTEQQRRGELDVLQKI
jgi:hypothetical protein